MNLVSEFFFQNQDTFLKILKKGRRDLPPPPSSYAPVISYFCFIVYIAILLSLGYIYFLDFKKGKQLEVDSFQSKLPLFQNVLNEEKNKIFLSSIKKASDYELSKIVGSEPGFSYGIVAWKLLEMVDSTDITDRLGPLLESNSTQCIQREQMFNKIYNTVMLTELVSSWEKLLSQSEDIGPYMVKYFFTVFN